MRWGKCLAIFGPILFAIFVDGCGPGRTSRYRRHQPRTPLVRKQHEPSDCHEYGLCAAGLPEGPITLADWESNTKRSHQLVPLYDDNIIITDEEGTGVDRMMTQRCVEKLKALAISVMNQWPSKKLRVVDGWIENPRPGYPNDSLHYEGRAVDITLSDRDRSHNGMLARLAVEAGFDWVYYETKTHIHCSVKSESSQTGRTGGCFPSRGTVTVEGGKTKPLSDLRLGERVLSWVSDGSTGRLVYSEVIMFLDRDTEAEKKFVRLRLSGGKELLVTPQHLVMRSRRRPRPLPKNESSTMADEVVVDPEGGVEAVFAARLEPNDELLVAEGNGTRVVRRILLGSELVAEKGVIAPLTEAGTVVIDGVVASCYAVFESQSVAHFAFGPVRLYAAASNLATEIGRYLSSALTSTTSPSRTNSSAKETATGVHWYPGALYYLSNHLIPSYLLYPQ